MKSKSTKSTIKFKVSPAAEYKFSRPAPRIASRRRPTPKRSEAQLERETALLLKYVKRHPGERMEQIQDALGFATGKLTLPMKRLVAEKIVRTRGDARGTRYTARA